MTPRVEVEADAASAAERVAAIVAGRARQAPGTFALALSKAPTALLAPLASGLPWDRVVVFQVDERVAPRGTRDRNLTALLAALPEEHVRAMPVDDADLEAAATRYGEELPQLLDVVHLGLGPDGHTASLVPGDPVLEVDDRLVAVTGEYQGMRRMTLTFTALDAAREIVWLVTGEEKREALSALLVRDPSIPAVHLANPRQLVVADRAAAP